MKRGHDEVDAGMGEPARCADLPTLRRHIASPDGALWGLSWLHPLSHLSLHAVLLTDWTRAGSNPLAALGPVEIS